MVNPIKFWLTVLPLSSGLLTTALTTAVFAQITPTLDSTGTIVAPNGNQIDLSGGKLSGDGTSLFHSFQQFNLSTEQTATFRSSPLIQNILGRVVGGDASVINGLIRVTGSTANLYLINPAGILFGPNAHLDVSGSFTATTATGVEFSHGWFNAFGNNDYSALVGKPQSFAFALSQPGAIANLGSLTVNPGQNLTLLGGTVLNAGTLSAPGGTITIASVAGGSLARISQDGALMNLELKAAPADLAGNSQPFTPVSLPALLTGGNIGNANTVTVAPDGTVRLARSQTPVATTIGATTVSGNLNVSGNLKGAGNVGGSINILGNAIALQNANLDASGAIAGGTIRIGGDFHGLGTWPTATQTWIDANSIINASALLTGNGGQVVLWANKETRFDGTIQARGGINGGNGGTVEVSGKDTLLFRGNVDAIAPNGNAGTLLLDPQNIIVVDSAGGTPDDAQLNDGQILAADGGASTFTLSAQKLASLAGTTNITLEATNNITISSLPGNTLTFQAGTGAVGFTAGGAFSMNAGDTIRAEQRSLNITAASITAGSIDTSTSVSGKNGGAITLTATSGAISTGALNAETSATTSPGTGGNVTLNAATGILVNGTISTAANASNAGGGNGGNVSLATSSGNLAVAGNLQTFSSAGSSPGGGGNITLSAPTGAVTAGNLASYSEANLGNAGNAGAIAVTAGTNIALSKISANSSTFLNLGNTGDGGNVTLSAPDSVNVGQINTASTSMLFLFAQQRLDQPIAITGNEIDLTGGANSVVGGSITLRPSTLAQPINVGGATDAGVASLDLTTTDLAALSNGFTNITIGQPSGTGTTTLFNSVTNTGSTPFKDPVILPGGSTLVGPDQATTWNITGTNTGNLNGLFTNGLTFSNISNLTGGNANNTFIFASNAATISGAILGGTGTDTLNYSAYTANQLLNLAITKAVGIETILGGNGTNILMGDNLANTWTVTGANSGTLNSINFINFQNLVGGSVADTFTLAASGNVTSINGGTGSNTLVGKDAANIWNITGSNTGNVAGVGSFTNIQNLTSGNQNQTVTFNGTTAQLDGNVTVGAGDLTLVGDKINIQGTISGSGNLLIQPLSTGQAIQLGGTGSSDPGVLAFTGTELNSLQNGFKTITIGRANGSGAITLAENVAFADPVTLRSPNGFIQTNGFNLTGTDNATLTLFAGQAITTAHISTQGGAIALTSNRIRTGNITTQNSAGAGGNLSLQTNGGAIATGALNTAGTTDGGNVLVTANAPINTGTIDARGTTGNGGQVTLRSAETIQTSSINTQAGAIGGSVDITTTNFFRATSTFTATNGLLASISTIGSNSTIGNNNGGSITIRHGGNGFTPFDVGNGTSNGTAGAITSGNFSIAPFQSFPGIYTLGNVAILTREIFKQPGSTLQSLTPPGSPFLSANSLTLPGSLFLNVKEEVFKLALPGEDSALDIERTITREFQDYLTLPKGETQAPLATLAETRTTLRQVESARGIKPALLYVYFVPSRTSSAGTNSDTQSSDQTKALPDASLVKKHAPQQAAGVPMAQLLYEADRPDKAHDTLELVLVTGNQRPIRRHLWNVTRAQVLEVVRQLQQQVTDATTSPDDYLPPAQQLYQWLVKPVRADLERNGIQNIIFILDGGLRSMPVVMLHNGSHFLVQDYSVSLMPSFSLTQLSSGNIHDMKVLAMGASEFKELGQLPAVPLELSTIAQKVWTGKSLLNQDFTIQNLKAQRSRHPFSIVHLATHGNFLPGKASNSYIQFWDQKLQLDQVRQLGLQNPPVELLVLSACTTALGDEKAELGFAGMAVQAGVIASLASLWAVSDDATLGLMTEFYHQLHSSRTKVEALRQAQLAMINGKVRVENGRLINAEGESLLLPPELAGGSWNFTHPKYWSAFTLIGNPW